MPIKTLSSKTLLSRFFKQTQNWMGIHPCFYYFLPQIRKCYTFSQAITKGPFAVGFTFSRDTDCGMSLLPKKKSVLKQDALLSCSKIQCQMKLLPSCASRLALNFTARGDFIQAFQDKTKKDLFTCRFLFLPGWGKGRKKSLYLQEKQNNSCLER